MKKVISLIISLLVTLLVIIIGFEFYYKDSVESFVNDKATIIYYNKNINKKSLSKLEDLFEIDIENENEIIKNIKDLCFVSQSKIYEKNKNGVFIIDLGKYYPIAILEINDYFNESKNGYYILKNENKKYMGKVLNSGDEIYLKNYKGLFIIGKDENEIEKAIESSSKNNSKLKEIMEEKSENKLGTVIINQGRERYLGIDMLVVSGDIKDESTISLDGEIYMEKDFLKMLKPQPEKRSLLKYLGNNKIYLSGKNIDKFDTFIFRMLSTRLSNFTIAELIQGFFMNEGGDLFSKLNGEVIIDTESGNYLFGLKPLTNGIRLELFLKNLDKVSIKKDLLGNQYLLIGEDVFDSKGNENSKKELKKDQVMFGKFKYKYMDINCNGYLEEGKLRIKSEIKIDKNREDKNDKNL
ncbi:hypothetical protein [Fusobacterium sp. IOR10]|uniref:hypothetical protein n=1 Tax=Fusobacterium sp. IOR10 TaxID=2665157 RepID=UPI0013D0C36A|nr:hypothetical protein [Fusobacterium sp. IOR10]